MDKEKQELEGSKSRDRFKRRRKQGPSNFYASDLDLVLVEKQPPGIVAMFDYKQPWDIVTFAESIAYNSLTRIAPIYIIEGSNPEEGPFHVFRFLHADWHPEPPDVQKEYIGKFETRNQLEEFEKELRQAYKTNKASPRD